jgi:hypothetical protein
MFSRGEVKDERDEIFLLRVPKVWAQKFTLVKESLGTAVFYPVSVPKV